MPVDELSTADLCVDAVYQGGRKGDAGDDPLPALLKVSSQGGFRYRGTLDALQFVVLTTTLNDSDWPDSIDKETGSFTYFGDNKRPGRALHDTPRRGNEILRRLFEVVRSDVECQLRMPPVLVFSSAGQWRDVVFLGLAVPGTPDLRPAEDLVAIWKTSRGNRFQNYRARFTILDVPVVSRAWINDVLNSHSHSPNAPEAWTKWCRTRKYVPLICTRSVEYRTKVEQMAPSLVGKNIIRAIHSYFEKYPHNFESCAAAIAMMMLPDITSLDLTRPSRDGGRDATGKMRIGYGAASILVDFALEAKCYGPNHGVGVREISRLISRLRHRQFGILVTTSYLDVYAYKEIKEDQHPVIVIAASDIVELLFRNGYQNATAVSNWVALEFPRT